MPTIRHYSAADRQAVREISCETAVLGRPIGSLAPDREIFADCITRYYTDYEPQALWVAESGGRVVGYVSGCLDSRRYRRVMAWNIVPPMLLQALARGLLFKPASWRLIRAGWMTLRLGAAADDALLEPYPAHLHINLREGFRGQGLGAKLIDTLENQLLASGVAGLHAAIRSDNTAACRLFERLGFTVLFRQPIVWPQQYGFTRHERVFFVKCLTKAG